MSGQEVAWRLTTTGKVDGNLCKHNKNVFHRHLQCGLPFLLDSVCLKSNSATLSNTLLNGGAREHVDRARQAIHFMCLHLRQRSKTDLCCFSPGKGLLFDTNQLNFVYCFLEFFIFFLVSSLHSCRAKHMFVLQSLVWCWRSLGSEMRLLTDGQVPLWPRYPAILSTKTHLCSIRSVWKSLIGRVENWREWLSFCLFCLYFVSSDKSYTIAELVSYL